jgi:hypothetical protein
MAITAALTTIASKGMTTISVELAALSPATDRSH